LGGPRFLTITQGGLPRGRQRRSGGPACESAETRQVPGTIAFFAERHNRATLSIYVSAIRMLIAQTHSSCAPPRPHPRLPVHRERQTGRHMWLRELCGI